MMALPLPEKEVREHLTDGIEVSVVNGPSITVVSGSEEAIAASPPPATPECLGLQSRGPASGPFDHKRHRRGIRPRAGSNPSNGVAPTSEPSDGDRIESGESADQSA